MPITQVGSTTTTGSSGATSTSVVVNKPTGIASGDFMVASVSTNADRTMSATGWTLVSKEINDTFSNTMYYKVAGGSEPANYTFGAAGGTAAAMVGTIIGLAGVDINNPVNVHQTTNALTLGEPATGPSATTTGPSNTRVFYLRAARFGSGTVLTFSTAVGGVTERFDDGGFAGTAYFHALYCDTADNGTAGVHGGLATTCSGTETHNVQRTFALNAADPFDTDTGSVLEDESIAGTVVDTDTGTGAETEFVAVPFADTDTGTGTEGPENIVALTHHIASDDFNRGDESPLNVSSSGAVWTNV